MEQNQEPHVLLLPYPSHGHINPMLQFAKRLSFQGIKTTLAVTRYISTSTQPEPNPVSIVSISDGFDQFGFASASNIHDYLVRLQNVGSNTLTELIESFRFDNKPVHVLVYDAFLPWAYDVGSKFRLKTASFFTQACAVNLIYDEVWSGRIKYPVTEPVLVQPGLPQFEPRDLPSFMSDPVPGPYPAYLHMVLNQYKNLEKADLVLVNSFYELEPQMSTSAGSSTTPIALWTDERTAAFIDICGDHLELRGSGAFLSSVQSDFNDRFDDDMSETQMKNKWDNLKRYWRGWNDLLEIPGGQWDVEQDRLDGSEVWWNGLPARFRKYRRNPPPKFRALDEMFGGCIGTVTCKYDVSAAPPPQPQPQPQPYSDADTAMYRDLLIGDSPPPVQSRRRRTEHATSSRRSRRPEARPFVRTDRFTDMTTRCYSVLSTITDVQRWEIIEIIRTDPEIMDVVDELHDNELLGYFSHHLNRFRSNR